MAGTNALVISDEIKTKPSTVPQGVEYVSGTEKYISTDINAETIKKYAVQNFLFVRTKTQQMNLIFPDPYTLQVFDAAGEIDEDVTKDMVKMCEAKDVNLWLKMQLTYSDVFEGGAMLANPVWSYENNVYTLKELRRLPWETFACSPGEMFDAAGEILTGIGITDEGEMKYFQKDTSGVSQELDNIIMIKNPTTNGIAGTPLCVPILPLISGSKFALNAQMQKVNRIGAPTPFVKVSDPAPPTPKNGNLSDEDYAQMMLKNYSKDILMPLRGSMDLVDSHMDDNGSALETIEYLNKQIIDYFSPSSMIRAEGNTIGGSDAGALGLVMRYISSVHEWIENPFEELLQVYLDVNGYEGYRVVIEIPEPEIDTTETDLKKAELMIKKPEAFRVNELRRLIGEDELEEFKDEFLTPSQSVSLGSFTNTEERPTVKQAEKKSEEEQKDAWDIMLDEALDAIEEDEYP